MTKQSIVIVMGSHRNNGNTKYFTEKLVEKLNFIDFYPQFIDVNKLNVAHCIDCNFCKENWGKCVHKDDMIEVYNQLKNADVLLVASPVYFNGVTSKLKTLVDRCQMIFLCDFEHHNPFVTQTHAEQKLGFIVSVGGANAYPNQFVGNEITLKLVFDNLRVPLTEHYKYYGTDHTKLELKDEVAMDLDQIVEQIQMHLSKINLQA